MSLNVRSGWLPVTFDKRIRIFVLGLSASASFGAFAGGCDDRTGGDTVMPDAGRGSRPDADLDVPVPVPDSGSDAADASADASTDCPPGSTLRRTRTACVGAPLVPPPAFASDLAAASPGDVVSMAGLNESTAPCLPVVVCTPADAPVMLFSDSPESPAQDGVLYADTVAAGSYRFYVYHTNGGTSLRKFPIVALNSGALPAKITIVRRGLAAPSTAYVSVGKTVLLDWFVDRPPVEVVVPAGARVLLDGALDQLHAAQNELVHALYDVVTDGPLKISFVSVAATADAAAVTAGLALLTRDVDHQRGTFPAADVVVAAASVGAQKPGVQRLRLGLDEVDDTLEGIDAPTGAAQKLLGNYGMLYRFALRASPSTRVGISPRGGGWGGIAKLGPVPGSDAGSDAGSRVVILPTATESLGSTTDAIVVGGVDVGTEVRLLTGGGSNLPIDLFLVTP